MYKILGISFFLLTSLYLNAQDISDCKVVSSHSEWFPAGIHIQPFTANFLEPRARTSFMIGKNELRLDIGATADLFHYKKGNKTLSFGSDLFTYTRLRGEKDFHFPVETIDYLFGINAGYKVIVNDKEYGFRLRISHISAHYVDGHYDYSINYWRNYITPRVYSREFVELFPFYRINSLRIYAGLTYLFHVNPDRVGKGIYQLGFDYFLTSLSDFFSPFIAYDFKVGKIEKFYGNNIISAGLKFGNYNSKGISVMFSYYSGKSVHGELFDLNENYFSFGINTDL